MNLEANRQRDSDYTLEILSEMQSQLAKMQQPQESPRTGSKPPAPNRASVMAIRASCPSFSSCSEWCSCNCHRPGAISANTPFNSMLGFLFVGYSGLPVIRAPCNERSCTRRSDLSLVIVYFFPLWFLARYLSMSIRVNPLLGPMINIRTPRLIRWMDKEAQLFHFAKAGNIDGIRNLFSARVASPFDLTVAQGESALFVGLYPIPSSPFSVLNMTILTHVCDSTRRPSVNLKPVNSSSMRELIQTLQTWTKCKEILKAYAR